MTTNTVACNNENLELQTTKDLDILVNYAQNLLKTSLKKGDVEFINATLNIANRICDTEEKKLES